MKTNYHPRNRGRGSFQKKAFIAILVCIFGTAFFYIAKGTLVRAASPVWQGENAISRRLNFTVNFMRSKADLVKENHELRERIESYDLLLISCRLLSDSKNSLLSSLGRTAVSGGISAAVLAHPPKTPYDTLIIGAGESDGISVERAVALPEGPKIGTVFEVFGRESKVLLYSAPGRETMAVLERHNVPVALIGRGGGNFEIHLPRDVEIEMGDKIVSPDLDAVLLGVVGDVEVEPTDAFKRVLVSGPANIHTLRFVTVLP